MQERKGWSRREFVQWMGYSSFGTAGLCSSLSATTISGKKASFAYVSSLEGSDEGIHVYAVHQGRWEKLQMLKSERPVALVLAPNRKTLYAVNEVDQYRGLPVGTVEAFAIHPDGRLKLLNRQRLALSAIHPRHAAVTPDGRSLVVAVQGGGAYNVLGIEEDGRLGHISGLWKETGVERAGESLVARPQMVAFDQTGRILSVDGGTDRLNIFGRGETSLTTHERANLSVGCGASQVEAHPAGSHLYVIQSSGISCHGYDTASGKVSQPVQNLSFPAATEGPSTMAVHPSGNFLYACQQRNGVAAWSVSKMTGRLRSIGTQAVELGELDAIHVAPDGRSLIALNADRGQAAEIQIDATTGRLKESRIVARVNSPKSLAVLYS
ncbi:lactonase family protein [Edaphobacter albus]|uniref:lactonase family protein n=1 Tax=Edaphobacter sp. 4G125 TaxID=2763071 RepID=UPI0016462CAE|nr:beta-propeller fold lactonase family protein [Edaphobacter sp. 4G125]QNI35606.1 beta-propeller fold lactonase family protein [Edaphobacter sp. 4G125]